MPPQTLRLSHLLLLLLGLFLNPLHSFETDRSPVIGIDLGTTFTSASILRGAMLEMIPSRSGEILIPSVVGFLDEGYVVGGPAKDQADGNSERTIFDMKRIIGRRWGDPAVEEFIGKWPFKVLELEGKFAVEIPSRGLITPEQVSALVLTEVRKSASQFLDTNIKRAVITIPANFNDLQRRATFSAAKIAGFTDIKIINEPTAAALDYSRRKSFNPGNLLLVCDFGGGTFDVSLVKALEKGNLEVVATRGDMILGGQDVNNKILEYFVEKYQKSHNINIYRYPNALHQLSEKIEKAKKHLIFNLVAPIVINDFIDGEKFREQLSRSKLESLISPLLNRTLEIVQQILVDFNLNKEDLHNVLLVGGSSRIPEYQILMRQFFSHLDVKMDTNPDEAIARGAAIMASRFDEESFVQEITPRSLGNEMTGDVLSILVPRGTKIPARFSRQYTTSSDNQKNVVFTIYEGENPIASKNYLLDEFILRDIALAPAGQPKVMLTFEINESGILEATAKEIGGRDQETKIQIDRKGGWSESKIEELKKLLEILETEMEEKEKRLQLLHELNEAIQDNQSNLEPSLRESLLNWTQSNKRPSIPEIEEKLKQVRVEL